MSTVSFPFPDRKDSMSVLEADPCFYKIEADQIQPLFDRVWAKGEAEAERFLKEYMTEDGKDMSTVLHELGFTINRRDVDYVMGKTRYFCEYYPAEKQIEIYSKSVALWAEAHQCTVEQAEDLILAHEYYHYLEVTRLGLTSRMAQVPMLVIGKWKLGKTGVSALSEVAANAFAYRYYRSYQIEEEGAIQ